LGTATPHDLPYNSTRLGDPLGRREQASGADGYLATGRRLGNRAAICDRAGATVRDAGRTSDRDGPEPGQLRRRRARSERRPRERSDGERAGPERGQGPR
jgi:hypothetical protein